MKEHLDIYDAAGLWRGRKDRELVHRDGDWHRTINVWIVRATGMLVFQRRSFDKHTWPGRLSATVGGHFQAGERLHDALRETSEEVGCAADPSELIALGTLPSEDLSRTGEPTGGRDRELRDVLLWPGAPPLAALRFDSAEITALVEVAAPDVLALLRGVRDTVPARVAGVDGLVRPQQLQREDFVPTYAYFDFVARAAVAHSAGLPLPDIRAVEPSMPLTAAHPDARAWRKWTSERHAGSAAELGTATSSRAQR